MFVQPSVLKNAVTSSTRISSFCTYFSLSFVITLTVPCLFVSMDNQRHNDAADSSFHPSLVQQVLQSNRDDGFDVKMNSRITEEALVAVGEVLRLFVQEAWHRASIEAECDHEGTMSDNDEGPVLNPSSVAQGKSSTVPVRPDHITKIAAELLMDFS